MADGRVLYDSEVPSRCLRLPVLSSSTTPSPGTSHSGTTTAYPSCSSTIYLCLPYIPRTRVNFAHGHWLITCQTNIVHSRARKQRAVFYEVTTPVRDTWETLRASVVPVQTSSIVKARTVRPVHSCNDQFTRAITASRCPRSIPLPLPLPGLCWQCSQRSLPVVSRRISPQEAQCDAHAMPGCQGAHVQRGLQRPGSRTEDRISQWHDGPQPDIARAGSDSGRQGSEGKSC